MTRRTFSALAGAPLAQAQAKPPNIVFLISDDHSYPDLGCLGNRAIRTPNLDRMAAEGMRLDNCFVTSAQCSPNRSAILTGAFAHTTSTSRLHTPMPDWESTFVDRLKERGYFAGAFRKVHQGPSFDRRWDFYGTAKQNFSEFFDRLPRDRPFFLHVGFTDPHRPYARGAFSPPQDPAKVEVPKFLPDSPAVRQDLANYYDEISRMDAECGDVFRVLKERGLDGDTLVMFTGDNGMPFPRAKGTCYDAGLHVPLLAWWKGKIAPGSVKKELISHIDLPATWLEAASAGSLPKMQGRSFLPLLTGDGYRPRTEVFGSRNWHDNFDPMRSIRTDRYKLIFNGLPHEPYRPIADLEGSPTWASYLELARAQKLSRVHQRLLEPTRPTFELYDLEKDPHEFLNLATSPEHQTIHEDLRNRLSKWMTETYDYLPPLERQRYIL